MGNPHLDGLTAFAQVLVQRSPTWFVALMGLGIWALALTTWCGPLLFSGAISLGGDVMARDRVIRWTRIALVLEGTLMVLYGIWRPGVVARVWIDAAKCRRRWPHVSRVPVGRPTAPRGSVIHDGRRIRGLGPQCLDWVLRHALCLGHQSHVECRDCFVCGAERLASRASALGAIGRRTPRLRNFDCWCH